MQKLIKFISRDLISGSEQRKGRIRWNKGGSKVRTNKSWPTWEGRCGEQGRVQWKT